MTWTFGLLRKAMGNKLGKKDTGPAAVENVPEHVDAESAIGIPRDEIEHHRKMGHIKQNRAHTFLSHYYSKYMLLVWLAVTSTIMVLHYKFFKHGKYYSHRDHADDISVFDFVGTVHSNPVAQTITALAAMLLNPQGGVGGRAHLGLLFLKLGEDMN